MITLIETSDYIEAITPFRNGHAFTIYIERDDVKIGYGCYCLSNVGNAFHRYLVNKIEMNKDKPISIRTLMNQDDYEVIRITIMEFTDTDCKKCSGTVLYVSNES